MLSAVRCSARSLLTRNRSLDRYLTRNFSFSFAGARNLEEIVKKELLEDKTAAEVSDIWYTYHEEKENVHGIILSGSDGEKVLKRAKDCPFFVQPVFRGDDGFFMMVSQFQPPSYFLLAYLEDYKMDPAAAQPLMSLSLFLDFAEKLDLTLVRCDIINKGIEDFEGLKVANSLLDSYRNDEEYDSVRVFNKKADTFDIDDFISCQNQKWKEETGTSI